MIWAANWKMNLAPKESLAFLQTINAKIDDSLQKQIIVFPQNYSLGLLENIFTHSPMQWGAQNIHPENDGAFTGENSVEQLVKMGAQWVLVGHSERRKFFQETNESCSVKIAFLQSKQIKPMYCVGENIAEREAGKTDLVLEEQLKVGLSKIDPQQSFSIAYEPVWAIGTGQVASPEQVEEAHLCIRRFLADNISKELAANTPILYGGSVKAKNCEDLAKVNHVDGFLIGGASLDIDEFCQIIEQTKN